MTNLSHIYQSEHEATSLDLIQTSPIVRSSKVNKLHHISTIQNWWLS